MKTLGDFYRENILNRGDLLLKMSPGLSDEALIQKDLFGWKIHFGKKHIDCRSEEEARYLKIFFDAGMTEVYVPKNNVFLHNIIAEIETLKTKIDNIVNLYLGSVLNRKIKEKVKHAVYAEIIK